MKTGISFLKIIVFTFLFFSLKVSFSTEKLIDSARIYYSQSEYEKALEKYKQIIEKDYRSAELFYNIGNCYYKLNKLPNAILWYERAALIKPNDSDIKTNLEIANRQIKDYVEPQRKIFFLKWFNSLLITFNSNQWALLGGLFFIGTLFFVGVFLFTRTSFSKKASFVFSIIFISLSVLSTLFSLKQKNNQYFSNQAIVFNYTLVKSSPNLESTNLFEINEGLKVIVIDEFNGWVNILLADGKQGWIKSKKIERL